MEYGGEMNLLLCAIILEGEGSLFLCGCVRTTSSVFMVLLQFIFQAHKSIEIFYYVINSSIFHF